jgi:hypothetical protein
VTLLLAAGVGCGATMTAEARVLSPAVVPVRAFPRVWVAGGHLEEEVAIVDGLARHLRSGSRIEARRLYVGDLEPLRAQRRIPNATVVIIATLAMTERMRPEWTTRPEMVCGPSGTCYETHRPYLYDVPTLAGRLSLVIYDGPSARVLQRVVVRSEDEGREYESMRLTVLRRLLARAKQLVDQRVRTEEVELLEVDQPMVERALAEIEAGDWHRGREVLESFARTPQLRALPREERARVLYDLGQARRYDAPAGDTDDARFAAAERALRAAMAVDPQERYARALGELAAHRRAVALVREQRAAARYNFGLAERGSSTVPSPPPSYQ